MPARIVIPARPVIAFLVMVAVTLTVTGLAVRELPMRGDLWRAFPGLPWLDGLCRWDTGWFRSIARDGYWYEPGRQSPVAFYPLFPMLMRVAARVVRNYYLAGIAITMAAGLGYVTLFDRWVTERAEDRSARASLWLLLSFPFAVYLFGAVYSDALFAFTTLAAFMALDKNRPWLAGILGAFATATRPVGLAVVIGLAVRAAERRGAFNNSVPFGRRLTRLRAADAGVLLSLVGVGGYCLFLWVRFGDPLSWIHAAAAPGWFVKPGPQTWFKAVFFSDLWAGRWDVSNGVRFIHAALCIVAYATLPAIWRRFGVGYAVYVFVVVSIPAISSPDFFGMGRYLLPAFPCFAVAGAFLHRRRALLAVVLLLSLLTQAGLTALFAAWYPVS